MIHAVVFGSPTLDTIADGANDQDCCSLMQKVIAVFGLVISSGLAVINYPNPYYIAAAAFFAVYTIYLLCTDCLNSSASRVNNLAPQAN